MSIRILREYFDTDYQDLPVLFDSSRRFNEKIAGPRRSVLIKLKDNFRTATAFYKAAKMDSSAWSNLISIPPAAALTVRKAALLNSLGPTEKIEPDFKDKVRLQSGVLLHVIAQSGIGIQKFADLFKITNAPQVVNGHATIFYEVVEILELTDWIIADVSMRATIGWDPPFSFARNFEPNEEAFDSQGAGVGAVPTHPLASLAQQPPPARAQSVMPPSEYPNIWDGLRLPQMQAPPQRGLSVMPPPSAGNTRQEEAAASYFGNVDVPAEFPEIYGESRADSFDLQPSQSSQPLDQNWGVPPRRMTESARPDYRNTKKYRQGSRSQRPPRKSVQQQFQNPSSSQSRSYYPLPRFQSETPLEETYDGYDMPSYPSVSQLSQHQQLLSQSGLQYSTPTPGFQSETVSRGYGSGGLLDPQQSYLDSRRSFIPGTPSSSHFSQGASGTTRPESSGNAPNTFDPSVYLDLDSVHQYLQNP